MYEWVRGRGRVKLRQQVNGITDCVGMRRSGGGGGGYFEDT